jgi:hypothetical protein
MAENIMAPSQMTMADTLTIIYFAQRAKFDAYKAYETELMMQCKASMKKLRSDWGGNCTLLEKVKACYSARITFTASLDSIQNIFNLYSVCPKWEDGLNYAMYPFLGIFSFVSILLGKFRKI